MSVEEKQMKKRNKNSRAAKRRRRRRIILGVELFLILILAGVLYGYTKYGMMQKEEIPEEDVIVNEIDDETTVEKEGYRNIALFGVDSRTAGSLGEGNHSDCIIVASINNKTGDIKLVSVYRDTYLNQSTDSYNKATQAYFSGGPKQSINMLNMNLDLDIKDYVSVDFAALVDVIDLLGGIEIDIQTADEVVHLNNYAIETSKVTGVKTTKVKKPGLQVLDGVQATSYARIRYTAGDDFRRTERQREVIEKIIEKAKTANVVTLNKVINEVFPQVSTSLSIKELIALVPNAAKYSISETAGFPFDKTTGTVGKRGSCVIAQGLEQNVVQLHEFLFGEKDYQPSATVTQINNKIIKDTGVKALIKEETEEETDEETDDSGDSKSTTGSGTKTSTSKN